jgi:hypothetical protein
MHARPLLSFFPAEAFLCNSILAASAIVVTCRFTHDKFDLVTPCAGPSSVRIKAP